MSIIELVFKMNISRNKLGEILGEDRRKSIKCPWLKSKLMFDPGID